MCGVCGFASSQFDKAGLDRMVDTMIHRGPDDRGVAYFGSAGLGFRRLSILDLRGGHQPMSGEDQQIVSVTNGEIYNYRQLRDALEAQGHLFRSDSDAEVVPHLYEQGGIDHVVRQLRGMFAVAIWDRRTNTMHLIRDHFGIKPLYYTVGSEGLFFASDIRSLLASGRVEPAVNANALWHYLTFQYVPDPQTMFAGVWKLPPDHYLSWHDHHVELTRYWAMSYDPDPHFTLPELAEAIHHTLKDSVARHMMSDVPRGAYLSSGIDSSAVVAFLRQHQELDTFSIGFGTNHGEIDELDFARETSQILGTRHHEVVVGAEEYQDLLPQIIVSQEDPVADPSAPALYFLAREARRHVTVVLSGEGADELFAGYPIYAEPSALRLFDYIPRGLRRALGQAAQILPPQMKGRGFLIRGSQRLEERYLGNAKIFSEAEKAELLPWLNAQKPDPYWTVTAPYYQKTENLDPVSRMQMVDGHTWLPGDILMKADKMSMAHSLELRVPFLDVEVFQLAARIPAAFKVGQGTTKLALRKAMARELPPAVQHRPKLGFPIPIRHWLKNQLRDFSNDMLSSANLPQFNRRAVQSLLNAAPGTVFNQDRKVWTLLVFSLWHQQFMGSQAVNLGREGVANGHGATPT
ncbi:asparagine synthase (glutamine-hydrolyzing) [Sulfobacillus harzensis]|uniref:asparagine synthase (glutamine-hydrolyzing) n=1 Tax=Sulfobacillus harzensis TaxID=2729629 RepID=A0A7Y0L460_9FIRM|nr:asparagine synthase (glutamine-hydrolyzing) [Sulfobacillus harzensis]NMP22065.1 asparagine synthase (glutamine-hydrolyzing) [Sulfobacillus harzensis]